jgi:hypothetical protein
MEWSSIGAIALGVKGVLLLLPGLCSVLLTVQLAVANEFAVFRNWGIEWTGGIISGALDVVLITLVIRQSDRMRGDRVSSVSK